jgi:hypothetical protein
MIEHVEQLSPGVHYQPVTGYSLHKTHRGNRPKTPTRLPLRGPRYFGIAPHVTYSALLGLIGRILLISVFFFPVLPWYSYHSNGSRSICRCMVDAMNSRGHSRNANLFM